MQADRQMQELSMPNPMNYHVKGGWGQWEKLSKTEDFRNIRLKSKDYGDPENLYSWNRFKMQDQTSLK